MLFFDSLYLCHFARSPCINISTDAPKNNHSYQLSNHPQTSTSVGITLAISQGIRKLLQRAPDELGLLPQVGREEAVCVGNSGEGSLEGVLEGLGRAGRGGVGVLDTSELEETLDSGGSDEGSTTRSGDKLSKIELAS